MSNTFDDPNRESVGLDPIWTGADNAPEEQAQGGSGKPKSGIEFDPAEYTVAEIEEYLAENPDDREAVVAAERQGKNRASITGG
jgi:hypothetical protein